MCHLDVCGLDQTVDSCVELGGEVRADELLAGADDGDGLVLVLLPDLPRQLEANSSSTDDDNLKQAGNVTIEWVSIRQEQHFL